MKRFFPLALAFLMLFVLLTVPATAEDSTAYDVIVAGLLEFSDDIDISSYKLSADELGRVFSSVLYNEPKLFFVNRGYHYWFNGTYVTSLRPSYTMSVSEWEEAWQFCDTELEKIVGLAPCTLNDAELALFFHDYICLNFEYDLTYTNRDIYTMLKYKKGVCMGYALLYDELLSRCGIRSYAVNSDSIAHMWNAVELDGSYYHVDCTWDDPVTDRFGLARHLYFLVSDSVISLDHGTDFYGAPPATDTVYDGHEWHESLGEFAFANGKLYCVIDRDIKEIRLDSPDSKTVFTVNDRWCLWGESNYWSKGYSGLGFFDDYLILNTPYEIFAFNPISGNTLTLLEPDTSDGYVYGCFVYGDTVHYILSQSYDYDVSSVYTAKIALPCFEGPRGDVSANGTVDSADYIMGKRYVLGSYSLTEQQFVQGDVNRDGMFNATDYLMIKRHVLGTYVIV